MAKRGVHSEEHIPIESDVCHITDRIREIDPGYFIMVNRKSGKFEVHHEEQEGDTLACVLPYEQLDARALRYVRETSIARAEAIFEELLKQDEKLLGL